MTFFTACVKSRRSTSLPIFITSTCKSKILLQDSAPPSMLCEDFGIGIDIANVTLGRMLQQCQGFWIDSQRRQISKAKSCATSFASLTKQAVLQVFSS